MRIMAFVLVFIVLNAGTTAKELNTRHGFGEEGEIAKFEQMIQMNEVK